MPATPLPLARDLDWLEHFSFSSEGGATDGARGVGLSSSVSRPDASAAGSKKPEPYVYEATSIWSVT
jgi:hypothetical protein